jgi:serine/threonine-protein phosphatase PGAM5
VLLLAGKQGIGFPLYYYKMFLRKVMAVAVSSTTAAFAGYSFCQSDAKSDDDDPLSFFQPRIPYPHWDDDWDRRKALAVSRKKSLAETDHYQTPPKRHLILIRHGQYVEVEGDANRILTPKGRLQAEETGKRLARMIAKDGLNVKAVRVSTMTRAKETADIIWEQIKDLPSIEDSVKKAPDDNLKEGCPSMSIPWNWSATQPERLHCDSVRIETAFRRYFYRNLPVLVDKTQKDKEVDGTGERSGEGQRETSTLLVPPKKTEQEHEFEIIVCHGNVIRYFFMRALQLPPEAWLRLSLYNCSLSYFTIGATGSVSCRMLGDVGHLSMENTTNGISRTGFVN